MGRKKGSLHDYSITSWLSTFEIGERRYTETTLESYAKDQRQRNPPKSRLPDSMQGYEFQTSLFTAVSASKAGDVRYLICTERGA